jgi:hypothetical protein
MALPRAQNRWRPPIKKVDGARDLANAGPPPQNEWTVREANNPSPPAQLLAKRVEADKVAHDGDAPLGTHKHMNVGDPRTGGQMRDQKWMGREAQHPLPPAQLRAQIVEAYQAEHDGQMPDREYVMAELWKRAGVNGVAEPRLMKTDGVPPSGGPRE